MKTSRFNKTLNTLLNNSSMSEIEAIEKIVYDNNIPVFATISSEDCEIHNYDNISKIYKLADSFLVTADSSEIDYIAFTKTLGEAQKKATDWCANGDEEGEAFD